MAQLVRASPCHGEGRRFEPDLGRLIETSSVLLFVSINKTEKFIVFICIHGVLAQLGEHLPYKQRVTGSSPVGPICILRVWWNRQTQET